MVVEIAKVFEKVVPSPRVPLRVRLSPSATPSLVPFQRSVSRVEPVAGVDAWVMPTCPTAPFKISEVDDDENYGPLNLKCLRNTFVGNFLHTCAISIPVGAPDGAPVGLMVMMPAGNDARLFSVAAAIEAKVGLKNV